MRIHAALFMLLVTFACKGPDFDPKPLQGRPLLVRLEGVGCEPGGAIDACYGEALRDRLSNQAQVLTPDHPEAMESATLVVRLRFLNGRGEVVLDAAAAGFVAGFKTGWKATGKSGDGLKNAVQDAAAGIVVGTLFGMVAAPVNAATAETRALYHNARLGYKPRHVVVEVALKAEPDDKERPLFETTAFDIVKAMRPMTNAEAREEGRLSREEAYALAKLVSQRMEQQHGWRQGRQARANAEPELTEEKKVVAATDEH